MALKLKTAPAAEPVSVAELKTHLRLEGVDAEDAVLLAYIAAARDLLEKQTSRAFVEQTWYLYRDRFAACIELPLPPLKDVSSIKYIDENGAEQTVSADVYQVDNISQPGRIQLRTGQRWPTPARQANAVKIEFVAGFGNPAAVPELLKHGIKLLCGNWYENRASINIGSIVNELPYAVQAIVALHQVVRFG